jgi:RNA polymerase sigma-70 factor (ECF subfamily)
MERKNISGWYTPGKGQQSDQDYSFFCLVKKMGTFLQSNKSKNYESQEKLLLERFRNGDKKVFGDLIRRYEKGVYRLCFRFFNNEEDAMDASQEVFLKAFRALEKFEGRSSFKTWLYRITANTCITLSEKKKREKEGMIQGILNWWSNRNAETPEEEFIAKETRRLNKEVVSDKIEKLPENYRMPLILKDIEGLPLDKISEVLEIPLGTTKSRINRGRRLLQESLQGYYFGRTK